MVLHSKMVISESLLRCAVVYCPFSTADIHVMAKK